VATRFGRVFGETTGFFVRKIDQAIDFSFIYDLVEDLYCPDNGRPSIDPVVARFVSVS
jgi:hypothetical protein